MGLGRRSTVYAGKNNFVNSELVEFRRFGYNGEWQRLEGTNKSFKVGAREGTNCNDLYENSSRTISVKLTVEFDNAGALGGFWVDVIGGS